MIGVVGDVCLDTWVYGTVDRICPEAPVPVFNPTNEVSNKGMAGNVFRNLQSLGYDAQLFAPKSFPIKTRYIEERSNALIVRVDTNDYSRLIDTNTLDTILNADLDCLVISDYNKGFLNADTIKILSDRHLVFLDTKKIIGEWCTDIEFIKLNESEYFRNKEAVASPGIYSFINQLIVTLGSGGTDYLYKNYPVDKVEVKDSVGAGDTFIAALAGRYSEHVDIHDAIRFANKASTVVVQKKGVATATQAEIESL